MWLLFLVSWIHCDGFDCAKVKGCCINKTTVSSCEAPGWCCSAVLVRGVDLGDSALHHYIGSDGTNRYWYCDRSSFLGVRTPQLTPQISRTFMSTPVPTPEITPARTYAKLSVKCHSKTETDLAVTLASALFQ